MRENDKFCADSTNASKCAIENFELLDNLLRKVDRFISIGFLKEAQSMMVLSLHISQRIQDEVSSFTGHTDLKYLGYKECLQFIFCPLKLEKFCHFRVGLQGIWHYAPGCIHLRTAVILLRCIAGA